MQTRQEPRFSSALPVHVNGLDKGGCAFKQFAVASNISRSGALLTGLEHEVRCGDVIGITHKGTCARFTVVWTRKLGPHYRVMVAVHKLSSDECPWEEYLRTTNPKQEATQSSAASSKIENSLSAPTNVQRPRQRRWERLKVDVPVRVVVHREDKTSFIAGRGTELSPGGMAVTAGAELQVDDVIEIEFTPPYSGAPIRQRGIVRNRSGYRYGIEFLIVNREDSETAEQLLTAVTHA